MLAKQEGSYCGTVTLQNSLPCILLNAFVSVCVYLLGLYVLLISSYAVLKVSDNWQIEGNSAGTSKQDICILQIVSSVYASQPAVSFTPTQRSKQILETIMCKTSILKHYFYALYCYMFIFKKYHLEILKAV